MTINPAVWLKIARYNASEQVDSASIITFRAIFGLLGVLVVARFFAHGWIGPLYVEPDHHFTYLGFGWVRPWPGWGMHAHFIALGALSVGIAAGFRPRLCAALFCVGFTYVELIDSATYLNHHYLMSLVSLLLAVLPFGRGSSPLWVVWTLRGQIAVVYLFAGLAKINPDWLFHALPMRIWLYQHGDLPVIGRLIQETWAAYVMSWGGALFDLAIVPSLLWRRTRPFAYAALVAFHLATWILFPQLGVFPWLMIGLSLIFFDPGWPRRLVRLIRMPDRRPRGEPPQPANQPWRARAALIALAMFAVVQLALPLRHFAYPGNVRWNEEGYRFAWRVMLSEKVGFVQYRVRDVETGQSWLIEPDQYLTPLQVERMSFQPDMIHQTARMIARDLAEDGSTHVTVNADAFVAFNGRPNARLIDPDVDLASVRSAIAPKRWVLPYEPDDAAVSGKKNSESP